MRAQVNGNSQGGELFRSPDIHTVNALIILISSHLLVLAHILREAQGVAQAWLFSEQMVRGSVFVPSFGRQGEKIGLRPKFWKETGGKL